MKNQNIVIVGQQAWDTEIGSNCKNIALEFAKHNRVLYVNPPLDRITKWRSKSDPKIQKRIQVIEGKISGLVKVSNNLHQLYPNVLIESINWVPLDGLFDVFNKINNTRFSRSIKKALKTLDFDTFILFNDSDMFRSLYLKELLKPELSIYYSRDNMLATDYFKKHGKTFEPKIIAKSDLCVANSAYLANYCQQYNQNSHNIGQGCDFELFDQLDTSAVASDIKGIKGSIIGYVGALTSARLDIQLITEIAKAKPTWQIVLVGPEDDDFKKSALHELQNVHFLGAKPTGQLPLYINSFNVCFNPQLLNELTVGNYPRKIDEYLALGKPTIATKTETMLSFAEHVCLAEDLEGYLRGITELLKTDDSAKRLARISFARSRTWENSVNLMYKAAKETLYKL
ncbi:teichuronic acid biosynthesis glycosyltransferase TuaH [Pedobacter sp. UYP30]|uniref:glycosyltransferase n=1 Tax=Pedobacter sp. UYP30 TaxID=1756400 RepID=UPI003393D1FD